MVFLKFHKCPGIHWHMLFIYTCIYTYRKIHVCVCVCERKGLHQFLSHTFSGKLNDAGTTKPCDDLKLYLLNRMAVLFSFCYSVQRERDSFGVGHLCTGCVVHTPDPPKQWISWRDAYCTGSRPVLLMPVNPLTCVSGVLTVSEWCSLGCSSHLEPLLGERRLPWHHACVSETEGQLECFLPVPTCLMVLSRQTHQGLSGWSDHGLRAVPTQPGTLHLRQLALAESLATWVLPSQMRVWEGCVHSPSHGPVPSVSWYRERGGISSLPSQNTGCHSLFVNWGFPGFTEFGNLYSEDHL